VRTHRLVAAVVLACATRAAANPLRVPLTLVEPVGVARTAEPVTIGVPLPAGRVRTPDAVWIATPDGHPARSQARALERWPDGSVRWLLLDFLATVGARDTARYTLRDGKPPGAPRGKPLETNDEGPGVQLTAGVLDALVPRSGPALVRDVVAGGATLQIGRPVLTVDDVDGNEARDTRFEIETQGPVRTEIVTAAHHASDLVWEARIAAFAGTPWLRVQLTVTSFSSRHYSRIRRLLLPVTGEFTSAALGVGGAPRRTTLATPHAVEQLDARKIRLDGAASDGVADGWVRAASDAVAVTAVRRWFPEEWPQRLGVSATGIDIDVLDGHDDPVELGIGAAKTFELWLVFEPAGSASDPATLATRLQHPLVPSLDAAWIAASHALANAVTPGGPGVSAVLPRLDTGIGRYLARNRAERWDDGPPVDCDARTTERERVGAFGALNWGDWNFPGYRDRMEGCDAWGNLEYDLTQVLGLDWAATGSRESWDAFVAAARHYRDVDIVHYAPGYDELVGINHPHKVKHFAVESKNNVDLGHTWLEGLLTHYRLTGEVRSFEAARGIAEVLVRRRYKAGNPRQYGWPMIALAAAYDATNDPRYRASALAYADRSVEVHQPTPAFGDWKMGILADGIAMVHAATGEARLRDWLVRYADALVVDPAKFDDPRYALPLGYLARLTGNARYREVGLETVDHMPIGDWGKTLAISGRTAFRILAPLAGAPAGATRAPAAPPRPSAPAPRSPSPSRPGPAPRSAD